MQPLWGEGGSETESPIRGFPSVNIVFLIFAMTLYVCIWFRVSTSLKVPWPKHPSGRVLVGTSLMCMNMGSH